MSNSFLIEDAEAIHDTGKALLIRAPSLDGEIWIPQSQIHDDSEIWKANQKGDLVVKEWFAEKKGWI
jgi:hypothetical protein